MRKPGMPDALKPSRPHLTISWAVKYLLHLTALGLAFLAAYEIRRALPLDWWFSHPDAARVLGWAALYALIGGAVEAIFQTERTAWRYVSLREILMIARNVLLSIGLFVLALFIFDRGLELPRSVLVLAALFSMAALAGLRLFWRFAHDPTVLKVLLPVRAVSSLGGRKPLVIVGPMAAADPQIRQLLSDPDATYQPVAVITPHRSEIGLRLHGVPFTHQLLPHVFNAETPARRTPSDNERHALLFLGDPVQEFGLSVETIGELRRRGHKLLRPQTLTELGEGGARALQEIPLEEFLPRQPIHLDPAPVRDLVAGRRVLVTGAGGSIGSEIARQLTALGCSHLTLLDHSEFLLFEIDRELSRHAPEASRRAVLANVRDEVRIQAVFAEEKPEIVFHAAALKHVGLVQENPAEGVLTNVLGTRNVLSSAQATGAAQFVLISTDKAADPSNIMGATKRVAESLLDLQDRSDTRLATVRFGNVLGSAGSVVPIFKDQIRRGGPVTVTDPEVNRFFMTIPEAVQLVLHSAAISAAGDETHPRKFLLEMGQPVKIVDLARQMIRLAGKTPDVDIAIQFTGLKPGEKMAEVLSDDNEEVYPCVEGVMEVRTRACVILNDGIIRALINDARSENPTRVAATLFASLHELFRSTPSRMDTAK